MKIVECRIQNVKAIKCVDIRPDGNVVVITGKNEQGKSSLLEGIKIAFGHKICSQPIHKGENKADIYLDLGRVKIWKVITEKGNYLTVTVDDKEITAPQKFLDTLRSELSFDPFEFSRMKAPEQRKSLMEVAGLDFTDLDAKYTDTFQERTIANRELKNAKAVFDSAPNAPKGTPTNEVKLGELVEESAKASAQQRAIDSKVRGIDDLKKERDNKKSVISDSLAEIKRLEELIRNTKLEGQALVAQIKKEEEEVENLKSEMPDINAIAGEMAGIEETNKQVRIAAAKEKARKELADALAVTEELTETLDTLKKEKADAIQNADFGIDGLSLDDNEVIFKGLPLSQQSTARQIQISTLLAMKANPDLRVIFISEGAMIGNEIWNTIVELAEEHDYQVWVEKYQEEAGAVGYHVESGEITVIDGVRANPCVLMETEEPKESKKRASTKKKDSTEDRERPIDNFSL